MIHSLSLVKYYQGFVAAQSKMSLWWTTQCFWSSFYKYIYEYFNENKTCFGWLMMFHSKHVLFSSKNIKKRFQKHRVIKAIYHFWNSSQACVSVFHSFLGLFSVRLQHNRRQHLHANHIATIINVTMATRNAMTSSKYRLYQGMLNTWALRCWAPPCLITYSSQSAVSSKGVRRRSFNRLETCSTFVLNLKKGRQTITFYSDVP